jgi:6-phosphogluconolactonase
MKKIFSVCCGFLFAWLSGYTQQTKKEIIYAGTFSERGSKGIYVFQFDRESLRLTELQTIADRESPTFIELHPSGKYLYAAYRSGTNNQGTLTAYRIDPANGKLTKINEQSSKGASPCHVSIDPKGRFVYVSNYAGGNLAVYPIRADGSLAIPTDTVQHTGHSLHKERQKEPHMHSIIPAIDGNFIYASDLGIDKIMIYKIDQSGNITPAKIPFVESTHGSGPRHLSIHPNGNLAFSVEELSSTISSYKINQQTGALQAVDRVGMLSKDTTSEGNTAADIHVSPDGKFVYASNRGQDNIVIYKINSDTGKMTYVGHENTHGKHPRNFLIDSRGELAFVANRNTDAITLFKRDKITGTLLFTGINVPVPAVVCIKQLELIP